MFREQAAQMSGADSNMLREFFYVAMVHRPGLD